MKTAVGSAIMLVNLALGTAVLGQSVTLDECESLDEWTVVASDGVGATLSLAGGADGKALRLDFDFRRGAGFCVIRHEVSLKLPANYRFSFAIRGDAPPNNLEFKLVDSSGENVWWVHRRDFEFPRQWQTLSYKRRHFRFAWGPSGGQPLEQVGAIELAVAASTGGKGCVLIDGLTYETLPEPHPPTRAPLVHFSSVRGPAKVEPASLDSSGRLAWASDAGDLHPWMSVDFQQVCEFGGLVIEWDGDDYATAYDASLSDDGTRWETVATMEGSNGGRDYVPLPEAEASQLRVNVQATSRGRGVCVRGVRILEVGFAESPNSVYATISREASRGWFPRYFLGEQQPWTVVGVSGDDKEALMDVAGALEVDKLGFRLEPFLFADGRLVTWADATARQSLADGYLPIPSVSWQTDDLELEVTALADGTAGNSTLVAQYRVGNRSAQTLTGSLLLAVRPFQVLPPWQDLNIVGGVSRVWTIEWDNQRILVNGQKVVQPWTKPTAFGAATFAQGDVIEYLAAGKLPSAQKASDPAGLASGALRYDFELSPGRRRTVVVAVPFHGTSLSTSHECSEKTAEERFTQIFNHVRKRWSERLNRVELCLPPAASRLVNTFKATQAYILINADGPAIQPGSRTYERSWIRDGALTSTALLYSGHPDRVRAFLEWYSAYQFPNGKVPCVVDRRGPDPVPEHDSTGQFIYLLLKYYRFTQDRSFLEKHLPHVVAGVNYIEALRGERLTAAYREGPPEMRARYGLVPESISHEGYSAKPMHSYWDSFFILRGLKDATIIARVLERPELERRFRTLRDDYREALYDSMRLAMQIKRIDYIPGCVELGDFDPTSTAIGVFPCGEAEAMPEPALTDTFARYYHFFRSRRDGKLAWNDYTPYEIRLVGTFVRLGQPQRAHELLEFFFRDQRPQGWFQWPEVVHRDPDAPKFIGDMPHTWVGSEYLNAVRCMLVYEREHDDALVLAAGARPEWMATPGGVSITNWPTEYGTISYTLRSQGNQTLLDLEGDCKLPPGGMVLRTMHVRPIQSVNVNGRSASAFNDREVVLNTTKANVVVVHAP